jgi:predicted DNA-binding transcriptional regulator AlpA
MKKSTKSEALNSASAVVVPKPTSDNSAEDPFMVWPQLKSDFGEPRSRWTIQRLIKKGLFPAPVQLSPNRVAWRRSVLRNHYSSLSDMKGKAA